MSEEKFVIRGLLRHYWKKGFSAKASAEEICAVEGDNPTNRKQWVQQGQAAQAQVRQDRFGKKIMLCVWWNYEGILHFELVPEGRAINAELYCEQLHRVYRVLKVKYPALISRN